MRLDAELEAGGKPKPKIERPDPIAEIVARHRGHHGEVLAILEEIQHRYRHLPGDALRKVADLLGRPLVEIYGVATFFKAFSLEPKGRHLFSVCTGTACHVRGAPTVVREAEKSIGVVAGKTTADHEYTLDTVNCLGVCAVGPIVILDGQYHTNTNSSSVAEIIESVKKKNAGADHDAPVFPVEASCPRCNHTLMDQEHLVDGRPCIRVSISFAQTHGWLRLSALYGSYTVQSEHEAPEGAVAHFFCPHCHVELVGSWSCPECNAAMAPMVVRGGGMLRVCCRRGCRGHMLDVGRNATE